MQDKTLKLWQFLIYAALLIIAQTIGATVWVSNVNSNLDKIPDNEMNIKIIRVQQDKQDDSIKEIKLNLKQMIEKQGYKWIPVE